MRGFVRTVETGSFSAVARESNTTQPTISKQIAALEAYLGVQLLARSTRSLRLTEEGARFYEHAQRVLESMAEAEASIGQQQNPAGVLRISCSAAFGEHAILPYIKPFLEKYPNIKIDLLADDRFINLVEEGVDLAIRVGIMQDPALVHQLIGRSQRIAIAAKSYLDRAGIPKTPQDLVHHECIVYSNLSTLNEWYFESKTEASNTKTIAIKVNGSFQTTSSSIMHHAVKSGLGIAFVPSWLVGEAMDKTDLQVVLQDYQPPPTPIRAVYRRGRFVPGKVKCFVNFLAHEFSQNRWLCDHS
jgi:DNA-binding transcriptional LysR family regulator